MPILRWTVMIALWLVCSAGGTAAWALSLEEAKAKGLVGERPDGYLGVVHPSDSEAQNIAKEINRKRRQAYEEIAKRNGTALSAVEALAGDKAIQNTRPGHYVQGPDGWVKK